MARAGEESASSTPLARSLTLASLAPFVLLAAAILIAGRSSGWFVFLVDAFKTWSAVTLAFLGGARFAFGLRQAGPGAARLSVAGLPALVGWLALFAPVRIGLAILLLVHCAQGAWDSISATRQEVPAWYGSMRIVATLVMAAAHIAVFVAVF